MTLNTFKHIYFIGIGGIGMSALAKYFHANGKLVSGYDKVQTPVTNSLVDLGITIHFEDLVERIPYSYLDPSKTLVIYTPAIPKTSFLLTFFRENNFEVKKRAEILGIITQSTFCMAVAGTHGKTTTSCLLGHIMKSKNATAFLGGISENYQSNLILGGDKISVVEADEFDRSFLKLSPDIACVTSMDADHLDIYGEASELENSFQEFGKLVTETIVVANGLPLTGITYGIEDDSDYVAHNIRIVKGDYIFDVKTPHNTINDIRISLPGKHNIMNAMAALTMAHIFGLELQEIKKALMNFKGVERRFSYKIKTENLVLIDDYAHHPSEIRAVGNTIKEMFPDKVSMVVFQPHLFSRTRDFIDDFARSLELFDEVVLLDIYPARELPIDGVTSASLLDKIDIANKALVNNDSLLKRIENSEANIIAMLGAGDIGLMVNSVKEKLIKLERNEA